MTKKYIFILIILFVVSCTNKKNETGDIGLNKIDNNSPFKHSFAAYCRNIPDTLQFIILDKNIETTQLVKLFYEKRNYKLAWIENLLPNDISKELLKLIKNSRYYGLDPYFYNFEELKSLYSQIQAETNEKKQFVLYFDFEVMFTNSCFLLMAHLEKGVLYPDTNTYKLQINKFQNNLIDKLEKLHLSEIFTEDLLKFQPDNYYYVKLQKALINFLNQNELKDTFLYLPDYKLDSLACYKRASELLVFFNFLEDSVKHDTAFFFRALDKFQIYNGM